MFKRGLYVALVFAAGCGGPASPASDGGEKTTIAALSRPVLVKGAAYDDLVRFVGMRLPKWTPPIDADGWTEDAAGMRAGVSSALTRGAAESWARADLETRVIGPLAFADEYVVIGLLFEAIPDLWVPAWLYVPTALGAGPFPAIVNFNGHEKAGALRPEKQARLINQVKRGFVALNVEWLGVGQLLRTGLLHDRIGQLDLVGTSGVAPFYLLGSRALDLLASRPDVDATRIGVTGLSGGGWQTILLAALDERVAAANPVAGHEATETRLTVPRDFGDPEQLPADVFVAADYAQLTAMVAPRALLLTYNANDAVFRSDRSLGPLVEVVIDAYGVLNEPGGWDVHINHKPGNHNFLEDNRLAHYAFVERVLSPVAPARGELHKRREILQPRDLQMEIPESIDFTSIAAAIAAANPPSPANLEAALQAVTRARADTTFKEVVRWREDGLHGAELQTSDGWRLPATIWEPTSSSTATTIVLDDEGRAAATAATRRALDRGGRVIALDLQHTGELSVREDAMWTLAIQAVGERSLGQQISALIAVARRQPGRVRVDARGPVSSFVALGAAALEVGIHEVVIADGLRSLGELIRRDASVDASTELFCFGLLRDVDVALLERALGPRLVSATYKAPKRGKKARGR